ncbi:hypothetical protein GGI43DRAFT_53606 [Trichoderma evansii]
MSLFLRGSGGSVASLGIGSLLSQVTCIQWCPLQLFSSSHWCLLGRKMAGQMLPSMRLPQSARFPTLVIPHFRLGDAARCNLTRMLCARPVFPPYPISSRIASMNSTIA